MISGSWRFVALFGLLAVSCAPQEEEATCAVEFAAAESSGKELGIADSVNLNGGDVAQSFQISGTDTVRASSVRLRLKKVGSPTPTVGGVKIYLVDDSSGAPGSTASAPYGEKVVTALSSSSTWVSFTLSAEKLLSPATTYWIRAEATYSASGTDLIQWMGYEGSGAYSSGKPVYEGATSETWTETGISGFRDLLFGVGC